MSQPLHSAFEEHRLETASEFSDSALGARPETGETAVVQVLAALFKASADPLRLEILRVLSQDSYSVQELCGIFAVKQSALSHHLKVLTSAGLLGSRREGNFIFYQRQWQSPLPQFADLQEAIFASVDHLALDAPIETRIGEAQEQRARLSRAFFADNADKFESQQELIATFEQYSSQLRSLLDGLQLPNRDTALEIGPGEGRFLPTLSRRFRQVIGLDNSAEMLAKAQHQVNDLGLNNVLLVNGDTQAARLQGLRADCVVINMVLHHTPSPAAIFQDVFHLLLPGGVLLVTELCHHDQNWVRDACGDLWLGFDPEDLSRWAEAARLEEGQALYLGLRNGFQFQIRQFSKKSHDDD